MKNELKTRPDGLILAGGLGRRVGGRDKGLMSVRGLPAVQRVRFTLETLCDRVFVSANRNLETYKALFPDRVLRDLRPGYAGPLAGLEALRETTGDDRILVLPCDMPDVAPRVLETLLYTLDHQPELDAVYAGTSERDHFLVTALRRRALAQIGPLLDRNEAAVRTWLQCVKSGVVRFTGTEAESLINRNRTDSWELPGSADDIEVPSGT